MQILLARHGNTFAPGDKVVWAGSQNDFPLVESGVLQAENCSNALLKAGIKPAAIYCGPLTRTRQYAQIIHDKLDLHTPIIVDERLNEIDYGNWAGLTNEEVATKYGDAEMNAWNKFGHWPKSANWSGSEKEMIDAVQSLSAELLQKYSKDDTIILVSSNGKLRYFLTLIPGEFEQRQKAGAFKMLTGNLGKLAYTNNLFKLEFWNLDPATALHQPATVKT